MKSQNYGSQHGLGLELASKGFEEGALKMMSLPQMMGNQALSVVGPEMTVRRVLNSSSNQPTAPQSPTGSSSPRETMIASGRLRLAIAYDWPMHFAAGGHAGFIS